MLKNGLYNLIGGLVKLCLSIVSVPLLLNVLGTVEYGLYAIISSILTFATLSEWSISMLMTVFVAQSNNDPVKSRHILNAALVIVLGLSVITGLILWLGSPFLASVFNDMTAQQTSIFKGSCQIGSLLVFTRLLQQYFVGIEQGFGAYKQMNTIMMSYNLVLTSSILICAWLSGSIQTIFWIQIVISVLAISVHTYFCWKQGYLKLLNWTSFPDRDTLTKMSQYAFRTYLGVVGSALFNQGDRIIIGKMLGLEAAGIYSALSGVATQINSLSSIPVQPIVPQISGFVNPIAKVDLTLQNILTKALTLNVAIAVGIGSGIILLAPEVIALLFRRRFENEHIFLLKMLCVVYTIYSCNAVGYYTLFALKKEQLNTLVTLICGLGTLLLIAFLTSELGLLGSILGNFGYVTTLILLPVAFKLLRFEGSVLLNTIILPTLVFGLAIGLSFQLEFLFWRVLALAFFCLLLIKPFWSQLQAIIMPMKNGFQV